MSCPAFFVSQPYIHKNSETVNRFFLNPIAAAVLTAKAATGTNHKTFLMTLYCYFTIRHIYCTNYERKLRIFAHIL